MSDSKHRRKATKCPNCGTSLSAKANYCPTCGQENHELNLPLGHLLYEFVEGIFHFDTKFYNTAKAIFTRPGLITRDFLDGRRARYVPPARLYIFVSVVFFFLIGKFVDYRMEKAHETEGETSGSSTDLRVTLSMKDLLSFTVKSVDSVLKANDLTEVAQADVRVRLDEKALTEVIRQLKAAPDRRLDSLLTNQKLPTTSENRRKLRQVTAMLPDRPRLQTSFSMPGLKLKFATDSARRAFQEKVPHLTDAQVDSLLRAEKAEPTRWNRLFVRQAGKLMNFSDATTQHSLVHVTLKYLSTVMFVLMPFVAFLLLVLYYRRGHFYAEHLVFSVHLHAVIFLFYTLALLATFPVSSEWTDQILSWLLLACWLYFLLSLKRVYRQSWGKTTLKFLLLSFTYLIVAGMFLVAVVMAGVLTF